MTQESLHRQLSLIPQDPNLFHRSLMENIRYGRLDATEEEVIEAARKATHTTSSCRSRTNTIPSWASAA